MKKMELWDTCDACKKKVGSSNLSFLGLNNEGNAIHQCKKCIEEQEYLELEG